MKIEAKYNVGDIVWLMNGQGVTVKATQAKIMVVNFVQDAVNYRKGNITYEYAKKNGSWYDEANTDSCNESYLFPTKEELLASL